MKISELKAYINDPSKTIIDVNQLRSFFIDLYGPTGGRRGNKRKLERALAKASRIEKLGESRFGKGWWE